MNPGKKWRLMIFEKQKSGVCGGRNGNSKLTVEKVKAIKRSKGKITQQELAEIYDLSRSQISRIQTGKDLSQVKVEENDPN